MNKRIPAVPVSPDVWRWVFVALIASPFIFNFGRMWDPPYWDAITGVYKQGLWLAQNGYDFRGLMKLPDYRAGGPAVNLYCLFALLFAFLSRHFSPPWVFFALHFLVFSCASLTVFMFLRLLRSLLPSGLALLWVVSAISNPIWSGQTASIYLEVPMACLVGLSIYFFWRKKYGLAAWICLGSYFVKSSAVLFAFVYAVFAVVQGVRGLARRSRVNNTIPWVSLACLAAPLLAMLLLNRWDSSYQNTFLWRTPGPYLARIFSMTRQQFPALGVQVLAAGALVIFSWGSGDASKPGSPLKEHRAFMEMLALFLGGFAVSFCLYQLPLARYWVMMIFPLTSFIAILAARFRRSSMLFALALIVWNGLNQYGRFLPALPDRSGHLLERSREFLKDLDANRFLCHKLEADFFNAPIVAKTPYAEMLTTPEFGYVQAALPTVIAADYFARFGKSADFQSLRSMTLTRDVKTLCLFSPTIFERLYAPSLVPRAGEKILLVEHSLPYPVVLYIRRWNKETAL